MISIPIPDGFAVPEGSEPGAEFEAVASLIDNGDGTLSLVSLDGSPIGGDKDTKPDKGKTPPAADDTDFAGAVMSELQGGM